MANEVVYTTSDVNNFVHEEEGVGSTVNSIQIGKEDGGTFNGAIRFTGINVAQGTTVSHASLMLYQGVSSGGSGQLKFITYGIDEDNTGDFSGGYPSRTKTSASDSSESQNPSQGNYKQITVTSIVNEVVGRGGWSSGNAMGFMMEDNGSDANTYLFDGYTGTNSYLIIRATAEPEFKPTPKSVAAPTFPEVGDCGIRISKPGVDVLTATESELYFTTRKKVFQVFDEGEIDVDSLPKSILHNLGYQPAVLAYANYSGKKYRFPDFVNYISGGTMASNKTYAKIYTDADKVYYYIFLEPIELV